MGVISGTGISEQVRIFYGVRVAQSLVISVCFVEHCRLFVLFFGHFILCHSWPFYSVSFLELRFLITYLTTINYF